MQIHACIPYRGSSEPSIQIQIKCEIEILQFEVMNILQMEIQIHACIPYRGGSEPTILHSDHATLGPHGCFEIMLKMTGMIMIMIMMIGMIVIMRMMIMIVVYMMGRIMV